MPLISVVYDQNLISDVIEFFESEINGSVYNDEIQERVRLAADQGALELYTIISDQIPFLLEEMEDRGFVELHAITQKDGSTLREDAQEIITEYVQEHQNTKTALDKLTEWRKQIAETWENQMHGFRVQDTGDGYIIQDGNGVFLGNMLQSPEYILVTEEKPQPEPV